mgnify:CR=1 FL=1
MLKTTLFSSSPHEAGFTLVEVLIAAAIVGSALALILQLFTSTSTRLHKASLHAHIILAQKQIVTDVEKINLSQQTQGKGVAEGFNFTWQAEKAAPALPTFGTNPNLEFSRKISLYRVKAEIELPGEKYNYLQWEQLAWE